jgi:hypothetical protein
MIFLNTGVSPVCSVFLLDRYEAFSAETAGRRKMCRDAEFLLSESHLESGGFLPPFRSASPAWEADRKADRPRTEKKKREGYVTQLMRSAADGAL